MVRLGHETKVGEAGFAKLLGKTMPVQLLTYLSLEDEPSSLGQAHYSIYISQNFAKLLGKTLILKAYAHYVRRVQKASNMHWFIVGRPGRFGGVSRFV